MQETVVADSAEALRQNMLQHQPQEVGAGHCPGSGLAAFALDIAESDLAIALVENLFLADDAAIEILGQVFQSWPPFAHSLALDNPAGRRGWNSEALLPQGLQKPRSEYLAEGMAIEQVPVFGLSPLPPVAIHCATWHHDMAVRVVVQSAGMGM